MDRFIALNLDELGRIESALRSRIPGAIMTVLDRMIKMANFEPGIYRGVEIPRGSVCVSVSTLSERTGLEVKTVRNALRTLCAENHIVEKGAIEGANQTKVYSIEIYESCIYNFSKGANRGQTGGKPGAMSYKEVRRIKEELKDQNLSPDGEGRPVALLPPASSPDPTSKAPRKAKPKPPADPRTDPNVFLHRVEAESPDTVLVWRRDVGAIKTLLSGRLRAGVVDPQAEVWGAWGRFVGGAVDDVMRDFRTGEMRLAHDVLAFVGKYGLLLERAKGGGEGKRNISQKGRSKCPDYHL